MALSCVLAGSIIVIGYFAYQLLVLVHIFEDITFVKAVTEVPFNILQVAVGTVIAVPIVSYLRELGILSEPENDIHDEFKDQEALKAYENSPELAAAREETAETWKESKFEIVWRMQFEEINSRVK